jgi:hypothetical protein
MAPVQVMVLVGIQLDITATPQSRASEQAGESAAKHEPHAAEPSGQDVVKQRSVCGAVRVACRSLCPAGLRRSSDDQVALRRSHSLPRRSSEVSRVPPQSPRAAA